MNKKYIAHNTKTFSPKNIANLKTITHLTISVNRDSLKSTE